MASTYDPTTSTGRVRLLISDTAVASEETRIFDDGELEAFLDLEGTSILRAAALAIEAVAASEVLIQKRIRILDLETDGPAQAKELRALAESWRARADAGAGTADEEEALGFAVAEFAITPAQVRERLTGQALRGA